MLMVDLKLFHAEDETPSTKMAAVWVAIWIGLGVVFGVVLYFWRGPVAAGEYAAGFLVEKALSVDNMFVFLVIFNYFRVPFQYQRNVLFYGILGAIVFRGIFIALGATLVARFDWVLYAFGVLLIYTAYRIVRKSEEVHPEDNPILKFAQRRLRTTPRYDGHKLFSVENGRKVATPLFLVLLIIESTDIAFAVDSIPAIFGITQDPFIVLTSNIFAILGLRSIYFLLAESIDRFHLLKYGLGLILAFVGFKMLLAEVWHPSIATSLGFIVIVLAITIWASLRFPARTGSAEHLGGPPDPFAGRRDGAAPAPEDVGSVTAEDGGRLPLGDGRPAHQGEKPER
jgi:tellurite resistance protein TerC